MAYTVNGLGITHALVTLPLTGAWHADVRVSPRQGDTGVALAGLVTLTFDDLTLTGTVLRSQVDDGEIAARIVGGAGKLSNVVSARYYYGSPTVRRVIEDILRDTGGETLAVDSSATVLSTVLAVWQRVAESAGAALSRITAANGGSWRVKPDGTVLIVGAETWPVVEPPHVNVAGSDPVVGTYRVAWADGSLPAIVLPGITFRGSRIAYVVHELGPGALRSELRFAEPHALLERLSALVAKSTAYSRLLPGIVERQNADGSVDVVIDNTIGLTQVALRSGVPGLRVLVQQGQQVLVGFEADDPRRPFAALWGQSGSAEFGSIGISGATAGVGGAPVLIPVPAPVYFEPTTAGDALKTTFAANPLNAVVQIKTGTVRVV